MTQPAFTLVDVGARGTLDARWRRFADSLRVIAIDADEAAPVHAEGAARHDVIRAIQSTVWNGPVSGPTHPIKIAPCAAERSRANGSPNSSVARQ